MPTLDEKIKNHSHKVAVIGLGYVGLPLVYHLAKAKISVVGIDVSEERVRQINEGISYIQDVPTEDLARVKDYVSASMDFDVVKDVDVVSICVPTPLVKTKDPDVSFILSVCDELKTRVKPGQLIILESTTYPGTTDELMQPILEESGLKVGKDFHLAFSPERVDPGNEQFNTKNTPKVVGGITHACTEIATSFYETFIDKAIPVSSSRTAEMVKLLENTFRMVNIGLVNELSQMCQILGIDTNETIEAAATKPFGFLPFYPGPGLGGHCIPVDPYYLSWKLKTMNYHAKFIELAGTINHEMPLHVVERINDGLNDQEKSIKGSKIVLLGVAYKANIDDVRESPALDIIQLLSERGGKVEYVDSYIPDVTIGDETIRAQTYSDDLVKNADCVVITTKHSEIDYGKVVELSKLVIDTRNATKGMNHSKIFRL